MNVAQYRQMLSDLELKRAELLQVHDQHAFGYAKEVLAQALVTVETELDELLNIELMPVPVVVSISSIVPSLDMEVSDTAQLVITATYSDGSSRDVTEGLKVAVTYRDADGGYNNSGFITSIDSSGYIFTSDARINIVKSATGWNTYSKERLGLSIVDVGDNTFKFVNIDGDPIGLEFTTDGNEATGDNWTINVSVRDSGTAYETSNESVVSVDNNGKVYALGSGSADIIVTNKDSQITIPVTVA